MTAINTEAMSTGSPAVYVGTGKRSASQIDQMLPNVGVSGRPGARKASERNAGAYDSTHATADLGANRRWLPSHRQDLCPAGPAARE